MKISEKQVLQLIRLAECLCGTLYRFGEYKQVEDIQNVLATINDQQSEELKELEKE